MEQQINNDVFLPKAIYERYNRVSLIELIKKAYGKNTAALEKQLRIFEEQSHTEYVTEFLFELVEEIHKLENSFDFVYYGSIPVNNLYKWIVNKLEG